jgi:nucleoside-diphosphate-sugar epimerase
MKVAVFGAAGWLGRAFLANVAGRHEIRACDIGPEAWDAWKNIDGEWTEGEKAYGDIISYEVVNQALEGVDGVVHMILYHSDQISVEDAAADKFLLVYLRGLWNVLEGAQQRGIKRVVHIGSCQTIHKDGTFFSSEVRRPDASLYAVCKRLQEEMCRQFYEAYGLSTIVLRPDYIVDTRIGLGRQREKLESVGTGWVCRHDLAEACRLALETETVAHDVLHVVGAPGAEKHCNVDRTREVLGLEFKGDYEKYI